MHIATILSPERTFCGAPGGSKKRVFENLANELSNGQNVLVMQNILGALMARERLGSTGLGNGIAIPHCRLDHCRSSIGALLTLPSGISFDSPDNKPVDLMFVLIVPIEANDEHLQVLASLAQRFNQQEYCQRLREATNSQSLYEAAISMD